MFRSGKETRTDVNDITARAIAALSGPGLTAAQLTAPRERGLYAAYGSEAALKQLRIVRDIGEPIYVGKAEKSLHSRDLQTHFHLDTSRSARTGYSTLRRSLAALLREDLRLTPLPRSAAGTDSIATFALSADDDLKLTHWMHEHLSLALWLAPTDMLEPLREVERRVIHHWQPVLNLTHVDAPWQHLREARAAMVSSARKS